MNDQMKAVRRETLEKAARICESRAESRWTAAAMIRALAAQQPASTESAEPDIPDQVRAFCVESRPGADWLADVDPPATHEAPAVEPASDDAVRRLITETIGFGFEPGELQPVNADDLMHLAAAIADRQSRRAP